jgi:hypothetical protein
MASLNMCKHILNFFFVHFPIIASLEEVGSLMIGICWVGSVHGCGLTYLVDDSRQVLHLLMRDLADHAQPDFFEYSLKNLSHFPPSLSSASLCVGLCWIWPSRWLALPMLHR